MDKLLTIVIAAYNKESLLPRCLDSLIVPSVMNEVEVLIINDGSKDNTLKVAQEYARQYPSYFIVIDKQNGNYGSVMNLGLRLAKGKYFRTLDADDWYDITLYDQYIDQLRNTNADLVLSERLEVKEKSNWRCRVAFDSDVFVNEDLPISPNIWNNQSVLKVAYVMGFAYKTNVIRQSKLQWTENCYFTDAEYCVWPLPFIKTVRFVPIPLYVYVRDVEGQSTDSSVRDRNLEHYAKVSKKIVKYYLDHKDNNMIAGLMEKFIVSDLLNNIYVTLILDGFKYKKTIDEFEKLVNQVPELYRRTGLYCHYRHFKQVDLYRNNRLKYYLIRLDYLIRKNKCLRSLLGK